MDVLEFDSATVLHTSTDSEEFSKCLQTQSPINNASNNLPVLHHADNATVNW
jgi:hypothetical protein